MIRRIVFPLAFRDRRRPRMRTKSAENLDLIRKTVRQQLHLVSISSPYSNNLAEYHACSNKRIKVGSLYRPLKVSVTGQSRLLFRGFLESPSLVKGCHYLEASKSLCHWSRGLLASPSLAKAGHLLEVSESPSLVKYGHSIEVF
ncbi:hypothetical protein RRG08_036930 [Elysia crispata]|uniref:Uncharacterized protein n=1 Tax=Elysia crispata TaxID=231223 RepID=A0AAE0ZIL7_9GAST|nr:hypothetical protein RRG08_036930 [Elysia crispata]